MLKTLYLLDDKGSSTICIKYSSPTGLLLNIVSSSDKPLLFYLLNKTLKLLPFKAGISQPCAESNNAAVVLL